MVEAQRIRKAREEGCLETARGYLFRDPVERFNSRCHLDRSATSALGQFCRLSDQCLASALALITEVRATALNRR